MWVISSICCIWTCRNQCSKNSKKNRQEMENRKTSARLLTFLMFGMPLCWMLFCVEKEWERMWGGVFWNDAKALSSPTDPVWNRQQLLPLQFTPIPAATWETVCRERELVIMWIKMQKNKHAWHVVCIDAYYSASGVNFTTWTCDLLACSYHRLISVLAWTWANAGLCVMLLLLLLSP